MQIKAAEPRKTDLGATTGSWWASRSGWFHAISYALTPAEPAPGAQGTPQYVSPVSGPKKR